MKKKKPYSGDFFPLRDFKIKCNVLNKITMKRSREV